MKFFSNIESLSLKKSVTLGAIFFILFIFASSFTQARDMQYQLYFPTIAPFQNSSCINAPYEIPGHHACGGQLEELGKLAGNILINIVIYLFMGGLIGRFIYFRRIGTRKRYIVAISIILATTSALLGFFKIYPDYMTVSVSDCNDYLYQLRNGFKLDDCYFITSNRNSDPKMCDSVITLEKRDYCYFQTSAGTKNHEICFQISTGQGQDSCLSYTGSIKGDTNICRLIKNKDIEKECLSGVRSTEYYKEQAKKEE